MSSQMSEYFSMNFQTNLFQDIDNHSRIPMLQYDLNQVLTSRGKLYSESDDEYKFIFPWFVKSQVQ